MAFAFLSPLAGLIDRRDQEEGYAPAITDGPAPLRPARWEGGHARRRMRRFTPPNFHRPAERDRQATSSSPSCGRGRYGQGPLRTATDRAATDRGRKGQGRKGRQRRGGRVRHAGGTSMARSLAVCRLRIGSNLAMRIGQSNDRAIGNDLPRYEPWNGTPV